MSILYSDLVDKVLRILDDPNGTLYEDTLIWDGICGAHDAIMPWVPKFATATLTAGSAGNLLALPADLYTIQAVQYVDDNKIYPRATLAPLSARNSSTLDDLDWLEYPKGYLNLSYTLDEGTLLTLYYFAYWTKPSSESVQNFYIEVPQAAWVGMIYYAGAQCLLAKSSNAATIRQFNLRIDSGVPTDNPLKDQSRMYMERFFQEMKMMPPYVKAGL